MSLKTVTIQHEFLHSPEKKVYAKLMDKEFKVKIEWKTGVFDDEALMIGFPEDVSKALGFHNSQK